MQKDEEIRKYYTLGLPLLKLMGLAILAGIAVRLMLPYVLNY